MLTTLSSSPPPQNLEAMTKDRNRLAAALENALAEIEALKAEIERLKTTGKMKVHVSRRGSIRIKPGSLPQQS